MTTSQLHHVRSRPLQIATEAAGLDQLLAAPVAHGEALLAARALQVTQVDVIGAGLGAPRFAGARGGLLAHGVPPRLGRFYTIWRRFHKGGCAARPLRGPPFAARCRWESL